MHSNADKMCLHVCVYIFISKTEAMPAWLKDRIKKATNKQNSLSSWVQTFLEKGTPFRNLLGYFKESAIIVHFSLSWSWSKKTLDGKLFTWNEGRLYSYCLDQRNSFTKKVCRKSRVQHCAGILPSTGDPKPLQPLCSQELAASLSIWNIAKACHLVWHCPMVML